MQRSPAAVHDGVQKLSQHPQNSFNRLKIKHLKELASTLL
jgi:hypothetical protein